jgi:hypothetical protein
MNDFATKELALPAVVSKQEPTDQRKCPTCGVINIFPLPTRRIDPDDILGALGYSPYGVSLGIYQKAKRDPGLQPAEVLTRYGQSLFRIYRERQVDPEHIRNFLHGVVAGAQLLRGLNSAEAMELHLQLDVQLDDRSLEDAR